MNTQNFSIDEARHVRDLNKVKVWRTIQLGENESVKAICGDLLITSRIIRDPYTYISTHDQIVCMTKKVELDLYAISVDMAGMTHGQTWSGVREGLEEAGYWQCPNEVGPKLAIDYQNQPFRESLWILTEPFIDKFSQPHMFIVGRDEKGCYLTNSICATDGFITDSDIAICCKRDQLVKFGLIEPY